MRARIHEFVDFGFGRREVEGLEKQFEHAGGGEKEIRQAADELIKALSDAETGKEERQEHERMLQQEEGGGSDTKAESHPVEVSASDVLETGSSGQKEPAVSQSIPAVDSTISPSAPVETSETVEALEVESESDTKQIVPNRTELAASSKSSEGSDTVPQSNAASNEHLPSPSSVSASLSEAASIEAAEGAALSQAAPAPPASSETMGESAALMEALESETEVETMEGELSAGRTPERPAEPATSADIPGESARVSGLKGPGGSTTPDSPSPISQRRSTTMTPAGEQEGEENGTVSSSESATTVESTETAPAQAEAVIEQSDADLAHTVDRPDDKH